MDWKLNREISMWLSAIFAGVFSVITYLDLTSKPVALIVLCISFIFLIVTLCSYYLEHKLRFDTIGKFREPIKVTSANANSEPVDSYWTIHIYSPNRLVKNCKIWLNNTPLPWSNNNGAYYRDFSISGAGNARISRNEFPDDILWHSEGKIMEGKKTRCVFRFAELKDVWERIYAK
jgi:hypothetical protein